VDVTEVKVVSFLKSKLLNAACTVADSEFGNRALASIANGADRLGCETFTRLVSFVSMQGMPYFINRLGGTNSMHAQGMRMRMRHARSSFVQQDKNLPKSSEGRPLRVGIIGELSQAWSFPASLGRQFPEEHELFMYDLVGNGSPGPVPEYGKAVFRRFDLGECYRDGQRYIPDPKQYAVAVRELIRVINNDDLDFLLLANYSQDGKGDIASLATVPCLVNFPCGSDLLHHPKVDYAMCAVPRMGYPLVDGRLQSAFTGKSLASERCCPTGLYPLDDWKVDPKDNPDWSARKPNMVFHGRMGKLLAPQFQEALASLLGENSAIELHILGGGETERIRREFTRRGVMERVVFHDAVNFKEIGSGEARNTILDFLRSGRLAPDPWPLCGGRSRQEAFLAGTPAVYMKLIQKSVEGLPPEALLQNAFPCVDIDSTAALDVREYKELSLKCLFDESFASQVQQQQYAIARRNENCTLWWRELIDSYHDWFNGTGWAAGSEPAGGRR
jgi:glycosyltransferase involved in cell wall biosynthesis